jgi:predicted transcriptional regulator
MPALKDIAHRQGAATAANGVTAQQGTATVTRLSVNLSREVAEALASIARRHDTTITEAVRRSISTQKYIEDALDTGAKILVAEKDGSIRELVFV